MSLQDRAKQARSVKGINQSEASRLIGISREAISQWENGGTKTINSSILHKAAHVYGVSAKWLATGEGSMLPRDKEFQKISDREKKLFDIYRSLSEDDKHKVDSIAVTFAASQKNRG